ncbi:olfactory receptor 1F12-like isoform X2 [Gallus gallus]|uniref:olfactory receptor 1F12-like isoform X2 n=1 Tax=Gallus gallus TaxID=9031 RepID=UPI001AE64A7C|nr:olfactory receptor 1F12-like isoform X2 [Gallus gallus]
MQYFLRSLQVQLVRFNLFVADLDSAVECTFSKFVGDTNFYDVVNTVKIRGAIQRDRDKLQRWVYENIVKINKTMCKDVHMDERIQGWRHHGVQNCHRQIQGLGGKRGGLQIGKKASADQEGEHSQMPNSSSISEFLLLALADTRQLQLLHFWLLLGIYLAALLGNGLISTAVACDHRLHTPMYFFLLNLALLDLGCISTTLPKAMANALWHTRAISYAGCAAQVFFFLFLFSAEYYLLTVMAYDRYVAICKPLHYETLISYRTCATMSLC